MELGLPSCPAAHRLCKARARQGLWAVCLAPASVPGGPSEPPPPPRMDKAVRHAAAITLNAERLCFFLDPDNNKAKISTLTNHICIILKALTTETRQAKIEETVIRKE